MAERESPQEAWAREKATERRREKREEGIPGEDTRWEDSMAEPQQRAPGEREYRQLRHAVDEARRADHQVQQATLAYENQRERAGVPVGPGYPDPLGMPVGVPYDPYLLPSFSGIYHAEDMGYQRALGYTGHQVDFYHTRSMSPARAAMPGRRSFGGYHQRMDAANHGFQNPTSLYRDGVPLLAGANVYPSAKYDSSERRR